MRGRPAWTLFEAPPLASAEAPPTKLRRRLSARTAEWALRARRRRDWAPPHWVAPLDHKTKRFLVAYFFTYAIAWLSIVWRA
jgi:hypothetical protein